MEVRPDHPNVAAGIAFGGFALVVLPAFLIPFRGELSTATIALVLVVPVVVAAVIGGPIAGAFAAIVATFSFDFFFTQPYNSMRIQSADDVEATVLMLVCGIIVGFVSSWGRRGHHAADIGSSDIRRIHKVAEAVAAGWSTSEVEFLACTAITEVLHLRDCRFEAAPIDDEVDLPVLERNGRINRREYRFTREGFELPESGVQLAVFARGQQVGRLVMTPTPGAGASLEQRVVAVAIADQLGGAFIPAGA